VGIVRWVVGTYLECRNDVALSSVALRLRHALHVEVTLEGCESHGAADNCSIVTHYFSISLHPSPFIRSRNILANADMDAMSAIKWILQFRTSGGSSVPLAWVVKQPILSILCAFTNRLRSKSIPYISQQTLILIPPPIGPKISPRGSIGECTDVCGYSQPSSGVVPLRRTFLIWVACEGC
jgi:hypothetical protein